MQTAHKTPAGRIIERFGVSRLAAWTGRHRSRIHAWAWPTEKGGTGGAVPARARPKIIQGALDDLGEVVSYAEFEPQAGEVYLMGEAAQ